MESSQATVRVVTTLGSKRPAATSSRICGMTGRTWARPVWKVQQREYISSMGRATSVFWTLTLVQ